MLTITLLFVILFVALVGIPVAILMLRLFGAVLSLMAIGFCMCMAICILPVLLFNPGVWLVLIIVAACIVYKRKQNQPYLS